VPTYQYACTACDEELEVVQKFTDDPLTICDACGGRLRKVYSPVGIVFKGSGFYRTDSRNGSKAKDKQANGSGDSSSGDSSSGKGDAAAASSGSSDGKSGSGEAKPAKKAEKAASSGTGSKVA
jgi:putative FmdB family regulatory protein